MLNECAASLAPQIDSIKSFYRGMGLTTAINYPYSGSIVPDRYYGQKDTGIASIMIEINKRIFVK